MMPSAGLGPSEGPYTPEGKIMYVLTSPVLPASRTLLKNLASDSLQDSK